MSTGLTFGSLFAGIGGLDLGLERAGMTCRWQVEIDPYCRRVLAKHWPDVPKYEDVRDVGAANLDPVDLICGGFPCQDISNAGKRAGIGGERSGLWSEYARIIRELRPRYVLVENVAVLLARGLDRVLGDLAESGYDAEWDCIPAAAVGAPHRRDRLFLVAYARSVAPQPDGEHRQLDGASGADQGRKEEWQRVWDAANGRRSTVADPERAERGTKDAANGRATGQLVLPQRREGTGRLGASGAMDGGQWAVEPNVGRVAHGVPSRVDRLRGLGNAVVPQVAEYLGRLILAHANETPTEAA